MASNSTMMSHDDEWSFENSWGRIPDDILQPRSEFLENHAYVRKVMYFFECLDKKLKRSEGLEEFDGKDDWFRSALTAAKRFRYLRPKKMKETMGLISSQIHEINAYANTGLAPHVRLFNRTRATALYSAVRVRVRKVGCECECECEKMAKSHRTTALSSAVHFALRDQYFWQKARPAKKPARVKPRWKLMEFFLSG
jgi:hypothetical protein